MSTNLQVVPLEQATDAELILAANFAGADEAEADVVDAVSGDDLTPAQRQTLIGYLNAVGYYNVQIDPKERLLNPGALVAFEVALPVQ